MEKISLTVNLREKTGKEWAKKIRRQGLIPGIVYGRDIDNTSVEVPVASMKILRAMHFSESTIIEMELTGPKKKEAHSVMIKDIQFDPLSEEPIHLDFLKVSLDEVIGVNVPLIFKGEPKGVKEAGAVVEQIIRELEVEGFPLDIPEKIEVDVSGLEIGHSLHVEDIKVSDKVKVINSPKDPVVTLGAKREEEEIVPPEEAAPVAEPEVIKEKKEGEEAETRQETKEPKKEG